MKKQPTDIELRRYIALRATSMILDNKVEEARKYLNSFKHYQLTHATFSKTGGK